MEWICIRETLVGPYSWNALSIFQVKHLEIWNQTFFFNSGWLIWDEARRKNISVQRNRECHEQSPNDISSNGNSPKWIPATRSRCWSPGIRMYRERSFLTDWQWLVLFYLNFLFGFLSLGLFVGAPKSFCWFLLFSLKSQYWMIATWPFFFVFAIIELWKDHPWQKMDPKKWVAWKALKVFKKLDSS